MHIFFVLWAIFEKSIQFYFSVHNAHGHYAQIFLFMLLLDKF